MSRKVDLEAWPFLIGRTLYQSLQVVVAPSPLCDAGLYGVLHQLTAGDNELTSFGHAYHRAWLRSGDTSFVLAVVFHVIQATERYLGGFSDRALLDRGGRPIRLIEGFACDQVIEADLLSGRILPAIHNSVIASYRPFWEARTEQKYDVKPTTPLKIADAFVNKEGAQSTVVLHHLDAYQSDAESFAGLSPSTRDKSSGAWQGFGVSFAGSQH